MSSGQSALEAGFVPAPGGASRLRNRVSGRRAAMAFAIMMVAAGAGWYGYDWWTNGRFIESTDDTYVGGNVTAIAPHVGGFIAQVLVADNQYVKAGQKLIRLDDRDYQAALDRATAVAGARAAALDGLHAGYALQQATIRQLEAELNAQTAQLGFAALDATRYQTLAVTTAGTRQDAQRSAALERQMRASVDAATAALAAGRQKLNVLTAQIAEAGAALAQSRADLRTSQLNLSYTDIRAPVDGYVGNRAAQIGAYVAAGTYLISVIPAKGLWVDANFKEDQLTHMEDGDKAAIVADVLPGLVFYGHVDSVAPGTGAVFSVIPAENATGNFTKIVQRVPVRIVLDSADAALRMLRPGLSATASVDTRRSVLADRRAAATSVAPTNAR